MAGSQHGIATRGISLARVECFSISAAIFGMALVRNHRRAARRREDTSFVRSTGSSTMYQSTPEGVDCRGLIADLSIGATRRRSGKSEVPSPRLSERSATWQAPVPRSARLWSQALGALPKLIIEQLEQAE